MKTIFKGLFIYTLLTFILFSCNTKKKHGENTSSSKPVIIAYVGGYNGLIDVSKISANKITHINYAFVDVKDGEAFLTNETTDTTNFRNLNVLKKQNADLKILISIGGWTWSKNFSDAVLTREGQQKFAKSAVAIMSRNNLDGVDIDWEYPAIPGDVDNIYRPEDKQNYTLMFAAIRAELDSLEKITDKKYLLTTAVGGFQKYIDNTEMDKVQQYLDYINIMSYDYHPETTAVHHTNLYSSDKYTGNSADNAVKAYIKAGIPAEKLVVGMAFYGRMYKLKEVKDGLGDLIEVQIKGQGFTYIKDSLESKINYKKGWDSIANAPYIFSVEEKIYLTYDDEQSVKAKCEYVKKNHLGGVMFWEYSSDPKEYLLDAANKALR